MITDEILGQLPELSSFQIGTCELFIKHTSASLSINEACDPDVTVDMESALNEIVPETWSTNGLFRHTMEGTDDMPAHVKASLMGSSLTLPIHEGRLDLG